MGLSVGARRPASVIFMRAISIARPPAITRSVCAVAWYAEEAVKAHTEEHGKK